MTMSSKEFVQHIAEYIEPLYQSSEEQTQAYFRNDPDLDEAIFHFKRRMFNERMNIVEIGKNLINKKASTDPTTLKLLSKQVYDEAKHYDMVRNVIEYLSGHKFTETELEEEYKFQMDKDNIAEKGASLFDEIGGQDSELMAATYQFVAEGRAARVWSAMATSIDDPIVSKTYAKISKDEHMHSRIGARTIEQLATTPEAQKEIMDVLPQMMERMFWINCQGTAAVKAGADRCTEQYGFDTSDEMMESKGKVWQQIKDSTHNWKPLARGVFGEDTDLASELKLNNFSFA